MTAVELESEIAREVMTCPDCAEDVHTTPAEGVPAQSLRTCGECGHVFFMDLERAPRYISAHN